MWGSDVTQDAEQDAALDAAPDALEDAPSADVEAGICEVPIEACSDGLQDMTDCANARVLGRRKL